MPISVDPRWFVFLSVAMAAFAAQLVWQWGEEITGECRPGGQVLLAAVCSSLFVGIGSWIAATTIIAHSPSDLVWGATAAFYLALAIVALQDARTMHVHDMASAGVMFTAIALGWLEGNGVAGVLVSDIWQGILIAVGFYLLTILVTKLIGKEARASGDPLFMAAIAPCMGWAGVAGTLFLASVLSLVGYALLHRKSPDGRFPFLPYLALAAGIVAIIRPELIASLNIVAG